MSAISAPADLGPRPIAPDRAEHAPAVHVEIHDREQLEIELKYDIGGEPGPRRYAVDAWLFVPRNVGVNAANYPRELFYGDVTALIRLDAAPTPLELLVDPGRLGCPLHGLTRALEEFRARARPPASQPVVLQVKLHAYLFTQAVKAEFARVLRSIDAARADPAEAAGLEERVGAAVERVRGALWAFREIRGAFWPFERIADAALAEALRNADEYMSAFVGERLALLAGRLAAAPALDDGRGRRVRAELHVAALAREEACYRARYGYVELGTRTLDRGEYYVYRLSRLKKSLHQPLFLDARQLRGETVVRNAIGSLAAALGAIWALVATPLPGTMASMDGTTKLMVLLLAVLAYVAKDRIKAIANDVLLKRFHRFDHDFALGGPSLAAFGLDGVRMRLREAMRFMARARVPARVHALRLSGRTVRLAESGTEEVVHYRKELDVERRRGAEQPHGFRLRDILRLNVRHFLVRLDDPVVPTAFFDRELGTFVEARLPKVYHLNWVLRVARVDARGNGEVAYQRLRVVLDKGGLVRVDALDRIDGVALVGGVETPA